MPVNCAERHFVLVFIFTKKVKARWGIEFDLVIKNGTVIDGTGAAAFRADVAVQDGLIVAVGYDLGAAQKEIDAQGCIVTPGFIDIHTHYDGQVTWDKDMRPSVNHGVSTVVMGSCGVGFAPVRPSDHEKLIRLMEGVEDIPRLGACRGLNLGLGNAARVHGLDCSKAPHH